MMSRDYQLNNVEIFDEKDFDPDFFDEDDLGNGGATARSRGKYNSNGLEIGGGHDSSTNMFGSPDMFQRRELGNSHLDNTVGVPKPSDASNGGDKKEKSGDDNTSKDKTTGTSDASQASIPGQVAGNESGGDGTTNKSNGTNPDGSMKNENETDKSKDADAAKDDSQSQSSPTSAGKNSGGKKNNSPSRKSSKDGSKTSKNTLDPNSPAAKLLANHPWYPKSTLYEGGSSGCGIGIGGRSGVRGNNPFRSVQKLVDSKNRICILNVQSCHSSPVASHDQTEYVNNQGGMRVPNVQGAEAGLPSMVAGANPMQKHAFSKSLIKTVTREILGLLEIRPYLHITVTKRFSTVPYEFNLKSIFETNDVIRNFTLEKFIFPVKQVVLQLYKKKNSPGAICRSV